MKSDDDAIQTLMALEPPAADTGFRAAVMARIARRRLLIELGLGLAGLALAVMVLALSGPDLSALVAEVGVVLRTPLMLLTILAAAALAGHRLIVRGFRLPGTGV